MHMPLSADELAQELRNEIASGLWESGDKLPSLNALVANYDVGKGAVQQAINKLRAEGLIESRHGAGNFVRDRERVERRIPGDIVASPPVSGRRSEVVVVDEVPAPISVAANFRIDEGAPVVVRRTTVSYDERDVQVERAYYPIDLARGTRIVYQDPGEGGVHARLAEQGAKVSQILERVKGRAPTPGEREELSTLHSSSAMVLEIARLGISGDRVVEVAQVILDASAFEVVYEVGLKE
jgi:GntR family transcriptional regulator